MERAKMIAVQKCRQDTSDADDMDQVYRKAIELWGAESQIMMLIEEMSELTTELCHEMRGRGNTKNIMGELADVEIMLGQIKSMFPETEQIKQNKLARLNLRIKTHEWGGPR